jgi:hypothetical protein
VEITPTKAMREEEDKEVVKMVLLLEQEVDVSFNCLLLCSYITLISVTITSSTAYLISPDTSRDLTLDKRLGQLRSLLAIFIRI